MQEDGLRELKVLAKIGEMKLASITGLRDGCLTTNAPVNGFDEEGHKLKIQGLWAEAPKVENA